MEQATLIVFLNLTAEEIMVQLANDTQQADIHCMFCEPMGHLARRGLWMGADIYVLKFPCQPGRLMLAFALVN